MNVATASAAGCHSGWRVRDLEGPSQNSPSALVPFSEQNATYRPECECFLYYLNIRLHSAAKPDPPFPQQRRFPRSPVKAPAEVRIIGRGVNATGFLIDMSEGGLAVATLGVYLDIGDVVSVELPRIGMEQPTEVSAEVRYNRGARYGLMFLIDQQA